MGNEQKIACPKCKSKNITLLNKSKTAKNEMTYLYICKDCSREFKVKVYVPKDYKED